MSDRDADFTPSVVETIAQRAGYRCSYPGCDESTLGPGAGPEDVEKKGVAAHIFAASSGSRAPRGTGGLSAEQRRRPANGIWLCQDHARLIDNDGGSNYPASTLQAWKALHENRIGSEVQKRPIGRGGWFESITFENNPFFHRGVTLILGKVTFLVGRNMTGKSAMCEWLSACAGCAADLWRWGGRREGYEIELTLRLIGHHRNEFRMKLADYDLRNEQDGKRVLGLSSVFRVVYVTDSGFRYEREQYDDDVEYLARAWQVHPFQVFGIVSQISSSKFGFVRNAVFRPAEVHADEDGELPEVPEHVRRLRHGRPPLTLWAKICDHEREYPFPQLSGSERRIVLVAGAMVIANDYSAYHGVLLLIDLTSNFDDKLLSAYTERLQSSDFRFQTILVSPSERLEMDWTGWSIAQLVDGPNGVRFEQNEIGTGT